LFAAGRRELGAHGIAILSMRNGLEFERKVTSDRARVWPAASALLEAGVEIHCLRDLTRGGLSSVVNEIASAANLGTMVEEAQRRRDHPSCRMWAHAQAIVQRHICGHVHQDAGGVCDHRHLLLDGAHMFAEA
jgi:AIR synthase related protein